MEFRITTYLPYKALGHAFSKDLIKRVIIFFANPIGWAVSPYPLSEGGGVKGDGQFPPLFFSS